MARPRIDLDGITLRDPDSQGPAIAVVRYRTTQGLILLMPESADFLVPWEAIEEAAVDLAAGQVRIRFAAAYVAGQHWLRGAALLTGAWTDRCELDAEGLL